MFTLPFPAAPNGRTHVAMRSSGLPNLPAELGTTAASMGVGDVARAHNWMDDACRRCGLRRREEWLLDGARRPVMALVWTDRSGDRQVQPFPPLKGLEPPERPTLTVTEAFPGLPVGPEPPCGVKSPGPG